jgi:hypothetical protein
VGLSDFAGPGNYEISFILSEFRYIAKQLSKIRQTTEDFENAVVATP